MFATGLTFLIPVEPMFAVVSCVMLRDIVVKACLSLEQDLVRDLANMAATFLVYVACNL